MASLEVTKKMEEKIVSPTFWPREYRQGFSEYHIEGYDNIGEDKSWVIAQMEEFESPKLWKKIPKDEKRANTMQKKNKIIINKHRKWLNEENRIKQKCDFFKIKYINPKPFPAKYETENEKKMNFVKNYYWILDSHVYPFQLPNNKEYTEVWNQWLYEDENRKKKLNQMIETEKSIVLHNNLKNKWLSLPEEVRNKISADYNERLRKIREETRERENYSSRRYVPSGPEYISACNGMVLYREDGWDDDTWRDKVSDFKENARDW